MSKRKYTEVMIKEAVLKSNSYRDVMRNLGAKGSCSHINRYIRELNLDTSHFQNSTSKGKTKYSELVGTRNGMLTVKEIWARYTPYKKYEYQVFCECDCGKTIQIRANYFIQKKTYSCGCNMKIAYVKYSGENSPHYNGKGKLTGGYWGRIINRCAARGYEFNLDIDYALNLFYKQNEKCALSGMQIEFGKKNQTASLDRIDSSKGYIKGNIQWVHKDINRIKSNMSDEQFIQLCITVANFNKN